MNNVDPFSRARPNRRPPEELKPVQLETDNVSTNELPKEEKRPDPFARARPNEQKISPFAPSEIGRHALRFGSRAAETVLGLPGDILNLLENVTLGGAEALTGADFSNVREGLRDTAAFKILPTSGDLRQVQSALTGGATEPKQDTWEEDVDNVVKAATALKTGGSNILRSLGTAIGAAGAGKSAKALGFEEKGQAAAEIGIMFLLNNVNPGRAKKYAESRLQKAENAIPKGTVVPTTSYVKNLDKLEEILVKGAPTSTKAAVLNVLKALRNRAVGGTIELEELVKAYREINQTLNSKGLFEDLSSQERVIARKQFEQLKDTLREEFKAYGQYNPEFITNWDLGNSAYAAIKKSQSIRDWIASHIKHIPEKLIGTAAFEAISGYPELAIPTLGAAAAGSAGLRAYETAHRFVMSPVLQKHYLEALRNAATSNLPATIKSIERLDQAEKKEKAKTKYR